MLAQYLYDVGILGLTEIVLRLKGFVLVPVLTRHFGPVNYGIWSQVAVLVAFLGPAVGCGLEWAIVRKLSGRPSEWVRSGLSSSLSYVFVLGLLVTLLLAATRNWLAMAFFGGAQNGPLVVLAGGYIVSGVGSSVMLAF